MADSGPHNHRCATAGADTECDCDCAGAQHAVLTTGGRPSASRVTDRAKRFARANGNPVVENDPSGGSVQSRERARRLPPPLLAEIERVRGSLPKGRGEWDALVPRGESTYDMAVRHRDEHRRRLADEESAAEGYAEDARQRAADLERVYKQSKIRADKRRKMIEDDPNVKHFREMAAISQANVQKMRADTNSRELAIQIADSQLNGRLGAPRLPRDGNGLEMPTADHNAHLDSILSVGRGLLDTAEAEFTRDPELQETRRRLDANTTIIAEWKAARARTDETTSGAEWREATAKNQAKMRAARVAAGLSESYDKRADERAVAARESTIIRDLIASVRPMGGVQHDKVTMLPDRGTEDGRGARPDAEDRLRYAEQYFPDDWLEASNEKRLDITSADRAYYSTWSLKLAMNRPHQDEKGSYAGGYRDYSDEVTVHELSHRMEYTVPGLMELEWSYVRRRSTGPDGNVEKPERMAKITGNSAYADHEIAFRDKWAHAYAGKTYEHAHRDGEHPGRNAWELMQVGTQDTFGRTRTRFDTGDELQAFTVGVLLTLGA